jgi:hypothetical protein
MKQEGEFSTPLPQAAFHRLTVVLCTSNFPSLKNLRQSSAVPAAQAVLQFQVLDVLNLALGSGQQWVHRRRLCLPARQVRCLHVAISANLVVPRLWPVLLLVLLHCMYYILRAVDDRRCLSWRFLAE